MSDIEFEIDKGVAVLRLNRPESLNSFTDEMHIEVSGALTQAAQDKSVRAVLITGNGRGFCAGQDLSAVASAGDEETDLGITVGKFYNPLVRLITTMEKPVICAVNGVAAGAGANLAFACDIVIAARQASFIESFSKLGLIPDTGGTWILPRLVGMARAKGLAMLGSKITAEQALAWGMIWQVVEGEKLMETSMSLARELATTIGVEAPPAAARISRWPRSLPPFSPGHADRMAAIDGRLAEVAPGLVVAGAFRHGVGIPACIRSGIEAASAVTGHVA